MTHDPQSTPKGKEPPPRHQGTTFLYLGPRAKNKAERATASTEEQSIQAEQAIENGLANTASKAPWLELPLAWIRYLRTELNIQECEESSCRQEKLLAGARNHLRIAEAACTEERKWYKLPRKANRLERVWANVRAADVNLLALSSDEEVRARCGFVEAMIQQYIHKDSPQRSRAAAAIKSVTDETKKEAKIPKQDRITIIQALGIAYSSLDGRLRRVRILANMLWMATGLTFIGAAALAIWGFFDPQTLNLCFDHPQKGDLITSAENPTPEDVIVCPTGEEVVNENRRFLDDYTDRLDVLSVELAGLLGAALTTIVALRRISDDHTSPYSLP